MFPVTIHTLYYQQTLNMSQVEAWQFFSSPQHLNSITPDFFHVVPTSNVPNEIYSGLLIHYTMKAIMGLPMSWLSEISHCQSPHYFIYQQRIGPFKFWSHEVRLTEKNSMIKVEDIVFYSMPFGIVGELMHKLLIAKKLTDIFETRQAYLKRNWG